MITVRKLFSLKDGTRERKIIKLLGEWERSLPERVLPDKVYLKDFFRELERTGCLREYREKYGQLMEFSSDPSVLRVEINRLKHELLRMQGAAPAEWDILHKQDELSADRKVFPVKIFLDDIRSPYNLGSIFRTAECLGVEEILLSPGTVDPGHSRARRTSMGCTERVPWKRIGYRELESCGLPLFAMELGGAGLDEFRFPREGVLIVGSEELGVSPECMAMVSKSGGVITIPLYGNKASLNVSVAYGVVMNAWSSFQERLQR